MLCNERTYGQAYNLTQDETPTLREVLERMAWRVGAPAKLAAVSSAEIEAEGLSMRAVSPFSPRWMSFMDPTKAKAELDAIVELGFVHTPLWEYVDRVVTAFLAHPPEDRPEGYSERRREIDLARRVMRNG